MLILNRGVTKKWNKLKLPDLTSVADDLTYGFPGTEKSLFRLLL